MAGQHRARDPERRRLLLLIGAAAAIVVLITVLGQLGVIRA